MRALIPWLLALCLYGCSSPAQTARAVQGQWESDRSRLVFTSHGLFGLYYLDHMSAGRFGVPASDQILLEEAIGTYPLRHLWHVEQTDADHLTVTMPDQKKVEFTRSKPSPVADPKIVGLWKMSMGVSQWNFYEINPDGSYVVVGWRRRRNNRTLARWVETGTVKVEKNTLRFIHHREAVRILQYVAGDDTLRLKRPNGNTESVYQRATDASLLER